MHVVLPQARSRSDTVRTPETCSPCRRLRPRNPRRASGQTAVRANHVISVAPQSIRADGRRCAGRYAPRPGTRRQADRSKMRRQNRLGHRRTSVVRRPASRPVRSSHLCAHPITEMTLGQLHEIGLANSRLRPPAWCPIYTRMSLFTRDARGQAPAHRPSARSTASAPAGTRKGLDGSFTVRHTASATSLACVTGPG